MKTSLLTVNSKDQFSLLLQQCHNKQTTIIINKHSYQAMREPID